MKEQRQFPKYRGKESDLVPEGVFTADLTDQQKAAMRRSIMIGRELQKNAPSIADDFRSGLTLDQIVEKHDLQNSMGGSFPIARNSVWLALRGYDARYVFVDTPAFEGLINREEYDLVARQHSSEASAKVGRNNRDSGLRQVAEKKGIHAQTTEERKTFGKLGVLAQGARPYEQSEIDLINELALLREYQRGTRINAIKIAAELNRRLYNGEEVRSPNQIKKMRFLSKGS